MTVNRRRFLSIAASFACVPALAQATTWRGQAFGGDVSITLNGPRSLSEHALQIACDQIRAIEKLFNLYDPKSDLSILNTTGIMNDPDPRFISLMHAADDVYRLSDGLFDPTVQPLWQATARGTGIGAARKAMGWNRVTFNEHRIELDTNQALTFNGIAQGFATDEITRAMRAEGMQQVLVNIGEYRALGGPWKLGLNDPEWGHMGTRTLTDMAIATSSPGAMPVGTSAHILHPVAAPKWSSVSVESTTATLADGLSTAMTLATRDQIAAILSSRRDAGRVTLVSQTGDLNTL